MQETVLRKGKVMPITREIKEFFITKDGKEQVDLLSLYLFASLDNSRQSKQIREFCLNKLKAGQQLCLPENLVIGGKSLQSMEIEESQDHAIAVLSLGQDLGRDGFDRDLRNVINDLETALSQRAASNIRKEFNKMKMIMQAFKSNGWAPSYYTPVLLFKNPAYKKGGTHCASIFGNAELLWGGMVHASPHVFGRVTQEWLHDVVISEGEIKLFEADVDNCSEDLKRRIIKRELLFSLIWGNAERELSRGQTLVQYIMGSRNFSSFHFTQWLKREKSTEPGYSVKAFKMLSQNGHASALNFDDVLMDDLLLRDRDSRQILEILTKVSDNGYWRKLNPNRMVDANGKEVEPWEVGAKRCNVFEEVLKYCFNGRGELKPGFEVVARQMFGECINNDIPLDKETLQLYYYQVEKVQQSEFIDTILDTSVYSLGRELSGMMDILINKHLDTRFAGDGRLLDTFGGRFEKGEIANGIRSTIDTIGRGTACPTATLYAGLLNLPTVIGDVNVEVLSLEELENRVVFNGVVHNISPSPFLMPSDQEIAYFEYKDKTGQTVIEVFYNNALCEDRRADLEQAIGRFSHKNVNSLFGTQQEEDVDLFVDHDVDSQRRLAVQEDEIGGLNRPRLHRGEVKFGEVSGRDKFKGNYAAFTEAMKIAIDNAKGLIKEFDIEPEKQTGMSILDRAVNVYLNHQKLQADIDEHKALTIDASKFVPILQISRDPEYFGAWPIFEKLHAIDGLHGYTLKLDCTGLDPEQANALLASFVANAEKHFEESPQKTPFMGVELVGANFSKAQLKKLDALDIEFVIQHDLSQITSEADVMVARSYDDLKAVEKVHKRRKGKSAPEVADIPALDPDADDMFEERVEEVNIMRPKKDDGSEPLPLMKLARPGTSAGIAINMNQEQQQQQQQQMNVQNNVQQVQEQVQEIELDTSAEAGPKPGIPLLDREHIGSVIDDVSYGDPKIKMFADCVSDELKGISSEQLKEYWDELFDPSGQAAAGAIDGKQHVSEMDYPAAIALLQARHQGLYSGELTLENLPSGFYLQSYKENGEVKRILRYDIKVKKDERFAVFQANFSYQPQEKCYSRQADIAGKEAKVARVREILSLGDSEELSIGALGVVDHFDPAESYRDGHLPPRLQLLADLSQRMSPALKNMIFGVYAQEVNVTHARFLTDDYLMVLNQVVQLDQNEEGTLSKLLQQNLDRSQALYLPDFMNAYIMFNQQIKALGVTQELGIGDINFNPSFDARDLMFRVMVILNRTKNDDKQKLYNEMCRGEIDLSQHGAYHAVVYDGLEYVVPGMELTPDRLNDKQFTCDLKRLTGLVSRRAKPSEAEFSRNVLRFAGQDSNESWSAEVWENDIVGQLGKNSIEKTLILAAIEVLNPGAMSEEEKQALESIKGLENPVLGKVYKLLRNVCQAEQSRPSAASVEALCHLAQQPNVDLQGLYDNFGQNKLFWQYLEAMQYNGKALPKPSSIKIKSETDMYRTVLSAYLTTREQKSSLDRVLRDLNEKNNKRKVEWLCNSTPQEIAAYIEKGALNDLSKVKKPKRMRLAAQKQFMNAQSIDDILKTLPFNSEEDKRLCKEFITNFINDEFTGALDITQVPYSLRRSDEFKFALTSILVNKHFKCGFSPSFKQSLIQYLDNLYSDLNSLCDDRGAIFQHFEQMQLLGINYRQDAQELMQGLANIDKVSKVTPKTLFAFIESTIQTTIDAKDHTYPASLVVKVFEQAVKSSDPEYTVELLTSSISGILSNDFLSRKQKETALGCIVAIAEQETERDIALGVVVNISDTMKVVPHYAEQILSAVEQIIEDGRIYDIETLLKFCQNLPDDLNKEIQSELLNGLLGQSPEEIIGVLESLQTMFEGLEDEVESLQMTSLIVSKWLEEKVTNDSLSSSLAALRFLDADGLRKVAELYSVTPHPTLAQFNEFARSGDPIAQFEAYELNPHGRRNLVAEFDLRELESHLDNMRTLIASTEVDSDIELKNKIREDVLRISDIGCNGWSDNGEIKKPIRLWSRQEMHEHLEGLKERVKDDSLTAQEHHEAKVQMVAILREVCKRTTGKFPYTTQLLPALYMLHTGQKRALSELYTGEGKTIMTALNAAFRALNGYAVDVTSSADSLAYQGFEEMHPFYQYAGIACDYKNASQDLDIPKPSDDPWGKPSDTEKVKFYQTGRIYYCSRSGANFYRMRGILADRNSDVPEDQRSIVLDEVDTILQEREAHRLSNSSGHEESKYVDAFREVDRFFDASKADLAASLFDGDREKSEAERLKAARSFTLELYDNLREGNRRVFALLERDFRSGTLKDKDGKVVTDPKKDETYYDEGLVAQLAHWLEAARNASTLKMAKATDSTVKGAKSGDEKKDEDFIIEQIEVRRPSGKYETGYVARVLNPTNGEIAHGSQFSDGVQQFLHIRMERELGAHFIVDAEDMCLAHSHTLEMLKHYDDVYGLSGTLGDRHALEAVRDQFGITGAFNVTQHQISRREELPYLMCDTLKQQHQAICDAVIGHDSSHTISKGKRKTASSQSTTVEQYLAGSTQPALVVFDSISEVNDFADHICADARNKDLTDEEREQGYVAKVNGKLVQVITAHDCCAGGALYEKLERANNPNVITVSTHICGRGQNIRPANREEGLFVVLGSVVDKRAEGQVFGRVGRNGDVGKAFAIQSVEKIHKRHKVTVRKGHEDKAVVQIRERFRDIDRAERLNNEITASVNEVITRLYTQYKEAYRGSDVDEAEKEQSLEALELKWAEFLQRITQHIDEHLLKGEALQAKFQERRAGRLKITSEIRDLQNVFVIEQRELQADLLQAGEVLTSAEAHLHRTVEEFELARSERVRDNEIEDQADTSLADANVALEKYEYLLTQFKEAAGKTKEANQKELEEARQQVEVLLGRAKGNVQGAKDRYMQRRSDLAKASKGVADRASDGRRAVKAAAGAAGKAKYVLHQEHVFKAQGVLVGALSKYNAAQVALEKLKAKIENVQSELKQAKQDSKAKLQATEQELKVKLAEAKALVAVCKKDLVQAKKEQKEAQKILDKAKEQAMKSRDSVVDRSESVEEAKGLVAEAKAMVKEEEDKLFGATRGKSSYTKDSPMGQAWEEYRQKLQVFRRSLKTFDKQTSDTLSFREYRTAVLDDFKEWAVGELILFEESLDPAIFERITRELNDAIMERQSFGAVREFVEGEKYTRVAASRYKPEASLHKAREVGKGVSPNSQTAVVAQTAYVYREDGRLVSVDQPYLSTEGHYNDTQMNMLTSMLILQAGLSLQDVKDYASQQEYMIEHPVYSRVQSRTTSEGETLLSGGVEVYREKSNIKTFVDPTGNRLVLLPLEHISDENVLVPYHMLSKTPDNPVEGMEDPNAKMVLPVQKSDGSYAIYVYQYNAASKKVEREEITIESIDRLTGLSDQQIICYKLQGLLNPSQQQAQSEHKAVLKRVEGIEQQLKQVVPVILHGQLPQGVDGTLRFIQNLTEKKLTSFLGWIPGLDEEQKQEIKDGVVELQRDIIEVQKAAISNGPNQTLRSHNRVYSDYFRWFGKLEGRDQEVSRDFTGLVQEEQYKPFLSEVQSVVNKVFQQWNAGAPGREELRAVVEGLGTKVATCQKGIKDQLQQQIQDTMDLLLRKNLDIVNNSDDRKEFILQLEKLQANIKSIIEDKDAHIDDSLRKMLIDAMKMIANVIVTILTLGFIQDLFSIQKDYRAIEQDVERGQSIIEKILNRSMTSEERQGIATEQKHSERVSQAGDLAGVDLAEKPKLSFAEKEAAKRRASPQKTPGGSYEI